MLEKVEKLLSKVMGGTATDRALKRIWPIVHRINEIAKDYESLSDEELKAKTNEFRYRLRMGETLDDILPEAFAAVKDTCRRLVGKKWKVRGIEIEWDMIPYDVQLVGGVVLHEGKIAEMATGEGKTLVATAPLYLNALEGKGAHLITVNDYLAQRDMEWMGEIYKFLGLTVSAIHNDMSPEERRAAYNCDITYGTNNEFGFDYLRDNMSVDVWSVVQRQLHYAIVDEVDSVLIDEARTPLIISGAVGAPKNIYNELKPIVANLYRRQQELVDDLIKRGKALLETDEEAAGMLLLRAHRGDPKNQALLDLLTSEFWVKKLIERIQGQYEINKIMHEVDAELYYTIDEKSHVIDITEKGRIFLSGGHDQDVAAKIAVLDELDERLAAMADKKQANDYFVQDARGYCSGFTLKGKLALAGVDLEPDEEEQSRVKSLGDRLGEMQSRVQQVQQSGKMDKAAAWRRFYQISKRMDKGINRLTDEGKNALGAGADDKVGEYTDALNKLLQQVCEIADVDTDGSVSKSDQDRRRNMFNLFFETEKQVGAPIALTEAGQLALIVVAHGGNPEIIPFIDKIEKLLSDGQGGGIDSAWEYFEFSDHNAHIKHITEKGRILLLGGNPDLYILPDRGNVEERDQKIQKLLDATLNQASYDYPGRVQAIGELNRAIQGIRDLVQNSDDPEETLGQFYLQHKSGDATVEVKLTELGLAILSNFAGESQHVVYSLDKLISQNKNDLSRIFDVDGKNRISGLKPAVLDLLLGASFTKVKSAVAAWQQSHDRPESDNSVSLRLDLDAYLATQVEEAHGAVSLSRRYEEVERIDRVMRSIFATIISSGLTPAEIERLLKRYFDFENTIETPDLTLDTIRFSKLSDSGVTALVGSVAERAVVAEKLVHLLEEADDPQSVFVTDDNGWPLKLQPSALSLLADGLPYFDYQEEFNNFRDEVLRLSAKKVSSRAELESLLPRDRAHLRQAGIMLDDRDLIELISKAHASNVVFSGEELEKWFLLHFEKKPRRLLEEQRDRQWREYSQVEERVQNMSQLLRAYTLYKKDVDYVVKTVEDSEMRGRAASARGKKAVMIVDQFTGRLMPGRRFSDGLHEALEAKEGVEVQAESQTLATITLQNFFRLYRKLAGMTGTAETEAQEFYSTYKMEVIVIPTNRPVIREDFDDVIYRTKREKYDAIISEALEMHEKGRPVLIGTVSVDVSQRISELFTQRGIPIANWLKKGDVSRELESGRFHTVLNAKFHRQEAEIVAKAGLPGAITIATNMAGRGTDIKLTPEVVKAGGLHIIGSEKHEARRIDRQLRGRAGRQGDPGSSRFYLSLEDDLMRLFGSDRITNIMSRMGSMEEGERIEHPLITKSIERAQKKVEERNFEIRKNLLEYDDVLNEQRKIIYKRRQNLLGFATAEDYIESKSKRYFSADDERSEWKLDLLIGDLKNYFGLEPDFTAEDLERLDADDIKEQVAEWVGERLDEEKRLAEMQERHRIFGYSSLEAILKELIKIKVRLYNAGSRDVSKWNLEGLAYEFERIIHKSPDWLLSADENLDADSVEERLFQWLTEYFEELKQQKEKYIQVTFGNVPLEQLIDIYYFALMDSFLNENVPAISWNVEAFLLNIERLFFEAPELGAKEIRTIRREKLLENLHEWQGRFSFSAREQEQIRHRILGYVGLMPMVEMMVRYALHGDQGGNGRPAVVVTDRLDILENVFGVSFDKRELASKMGGDILEEVYGRCREAYLNSLSENLDTYFSCLVGDASIEEMVEAGILAMTDSVLESELGHEDKRKRIAAIFQFVFNDKPRLPMPDQADKDALLSYREDLVAWGLNFYKVYSEQVERIRQERLSGEIVRDSIIMWIDDTVYNIISGVLGEGDDLDASQVRRIESECRLVFRQSPRLVDENVEAYHPTAIKNELSEWAKSQYKRRVQELGENRVTRYERYYTLEKIDENWRQHLAAIDDVREGIGLRGYGQKDPLLEYKSEAYKMFVKMVEDTSRSVISTLFKVFDIGGEFEERQMRRIEPKSFVTSHSQVEVFKQAAVQKQASAAAQTPAQPPRQRTVIKDDRVGRNEPCPCGSGKKYKNCCGRNV